MEMAQQVSAQSPRPRPKSSSMISRLTRCVMSCAKLSPTYECEYCCEKRISKAFTLTNPTPSQCRGHLRHVCRSCIKSTLQAQLQSRALRDVGCPACSQSWDWKEQRRFYGLKPGKGKNKAQLDTMQNLHLLGKGMPLVPQRLPEEATIATMLDAGVRFCPWCRFPFVKEGGCKHMECESRSQFSIVSICKKSGMRGSC